MTETEFIDRIVAEVMNRLSGSASGEPSSDAGDSHGSGRLVLDQPVLTEESLSELVTDQTTIEIGPRTVLTPTARDWLRHRSVEVIRGKGTRNSTSTNDWLLVVESETESTRLVAEQPGCASENVTSVAAAASRAMTAIADGAHSGCVVLTAQPDVVACLANRDEMIRAAVVDDVAAVRRVKESLEANLLVIDPAERSFFELRNLLRAIAG